MNDTYNKKNDMPRPVTVWLSYVGYPVTTAAYLERAFRSICRTVTVGPPMPDELIERWQLQNMKLPPIQHDIVTCFTPDMGMVLQQNAGKPKPDLYLWVESVPSHSPTNLKALGCATACYFIDSHLSLAKHLNLAESFDYVFIAQRAYLNEFRKVNHRTYWLPLACDPEIHRAWDVNKKFDVGFVGSVTLGSEREAYLKILSNVVPVHYERCFWDDMAKVFSASKMVFNNAVNHDLNMRFFEVLSTGTLLLSDMTINSGQSELFCDGEDYSCYHKGNLGDIAHFYLENEQLRNRIAQRGQQLVHNAHTYRHRAEDLLDVVLSGKRDTYSATELRQRSLSGVPEPLEEIRLQTEAHRPCRSFVIPVLDYSPASEYNILTLLADLEQIEGEVIVIFNGALIGEELKEHPRITRHAIMKQNIGVARAWNIGLNMAESDMVFIVNADAHISQNAVTALESGLQNIPDAACVGPQGSFVNFTLCRDYRYFDKGSFDQPVEVDAVSGFFFALNHKLCDEYGIRFENAFTPCYCEEWDFGLQIRRAGLKSYIIPTDAYDHHWSGTIRALRTIPYMGKEETATDILLHNRQILLAKWRTIVREEHRAALLESGWKRYMLTVVKNHLSTGNHIEARQAIESLTLDFPDDFMVASLSRLVELSEP